MCLPYGIDEQYVYIESFLNEASNSAILHIRESYYETPSILTIAVQAWEVKHGSENVRIQYIESDSAIKRILTHKKTNQIKRIILDIPYEVGWKWIDYTKCRIVTAVRSGCFI